MTSILCAPGRRFHVRFLSTVVLLLLVGVPAVRGQQAAEQVETSLAGTWSLLVDPGAVGLEQHWERPLSRSEHPPGSPAEALQIAVPGPLEGTAQTANYDGVVWYSHVFEAPWGALRGTAPVRSVLTFERVNYVCKVWLDGIEVGGHEGGYEPFELDITHVLGEPGPHTLVLRVLDPGAVATDGMRLKTTPHSKESWYENHGGILGDVALVQTAGYAGELVRVLPDPLTGDVAVVWKLHGAPGSAAPGRVRLALEELGLLEPGEDPPAPRPDGELPWVVAEQDLAVDPAGAAQVEGTTTLSLPEPHRWSPEDPWLFRVALDVDGVRTTRTLGFRHVALDVSGLRLDGRSRRVHAVLWQPHFTGTGGMTPSDEELQDTARAMHAAGFDMVRAHVRPAPPAFLDACDRLGLLVLEEPAIGWVDDDEHLRERLLAEVRWMVARDQHHPALVLWGVLNELSGKAYRYAEELTREIGRLDATRPVLEDSGGFFGNGRFLPAGLDELHPMHDEHVYPPWPLPLDERERMRALASHLGPVFVSEFGFGGPVEVEHVAEGFQALPFHMMERRGFNTMAGVHARARESGEAWSSEGWLEAGQRAQADAAVAMTEALRVNPSLDLLCYTQWNAVSHEASAGLVSPWGRERPALAELRDAFRDPLLTLLPNRSSARPGEVVTVEVAVVRDDPEALDLELVLHAEGARWINAELQDVERLERDLHIERGVTIQALGLRLDERVGEVRLWGSLVDATGAERESSRIVSLPVVAEAAVPRETHAGSLSVHVPDGDPRALAFARRHGLPVLDLEAALADPACVVLLSRPAALARAVSWNARMAVWAKVHAGGAALLLVDGPTGGVRTLLGGARGVQTLAQLPVELHLAAAAGNFQGRLHLARGLDSPSGLDQPVFEDDPRGGDVRTLGEQDASLSPEAMLVDPVPPGTAAAWITLGHAGDRIGSPVARVPFGQGAFVVAGLPLLEPVLGEVDARRETLLLELLRAAAESTRPEAGPPAWTDLPDLHAATLEYGMELVGRVAGLAERFSVVRGGRVNTYALPEEVGAALALQHRAVEAFLAGRTGEGRQLMLEALSAVWGEQVAAFLALEESVLGLLDERIESGRRDQLDEAYEMLEAWTFGMAHWFAGERQTALDWLGRAELLGLGPDAPPAPDDAP